MRVIVVGARPSRTDEDVLRAVHDVPGVALVGLKVGGPGALRDVDVTLLTPHGLLVVEGKGARRNGRSYTGELKVAKNRPWTVAGDPGLFDGRTPPHIQARNAMQALKAELEAVAGLPWLSWAVAVAGRSVTLTPNPFQLGDGWVCLVSALPQVLAAMDAPVPAEVAARVLGALELGDANTLGVDELLTEGFPKFAERSRRPARALRDLSVEVGEVHEEIDSVLRGAGFSEDLDGVGGRLAALQLLVSLRGPHWEMQRSHLGALPAAMRRHIRLAATLLARLGRDDPELERWQDRLLAEAQVQELPLSELVPDALPTDLAEAASQIDVVRQADAQYAAVERRLADLSEELRDVAAKTVAALGDRRQLEAPPGEYDWSDLQHLVRHRDRLATVLRRRAALDQALQHAQESWPGLCRANVTGADNAAARPNQTPPPGRAARTRRQLEDARVALAEEQAAIADVPADLRDRAITLTQDELDQQLALHDWVAGLALDDVEAQELCRQEALRLDVVELAYASAARSLPAELKWLGQHLPPTQGRQAFLDAVQACISHPWPTARLNWTENQRRTVEDLKGFLRMLHAGDAWPSEVGPASLVEAGPVVRGLTEHAPGLVDQLVVTVLPEDDRAAQLLTVLRRVEASLDDNSIAALAGEERGRLEEAIEKAGWAGSASDGRVGHEVSRPSRPKDTTAAPAHPAPRVPPTERVVTRERTVEVPIYQERVVEVPVERIVYQERVVEVPVERVVYQERVVEVPAASVSGEAADEERPLLRFGLQLPLAEDVPHYESSSVTFSRPSKIGIDVAMRRSYLDYAMSVVVGRALPDVRDGLKSVHRRVLYGLYLQGALPEREHVKSAHAVGLVMGNFHPHGDLAIYDTLVRMAQPWSLRYPLVDGNGNFGSPGNDLAAAQRYTAVRLTQHGMAMLRGIHFGAVEGVPAYSGLSREPVVLPSRLPNLLINGSSGIAVGFATNIPPHNLTEIVAAVQWRLERPSAPTDQFLDELLRRVQGPDFPTGGLIVGRAGIEDAYRTGRGSIRMRAIVELDEDKKGRTILVVTELPYQVNPDNLAEAIADHVREGRIAGIADVRDEGAQRNGQRLVIVLKRDAVSKVVLNNLYKHTQLQQTFGANMMAIVDGVPRTLRLDEFIDHYIQHHGEVMAAEARWRLARAGLQGYALTRQQRHHLEALTSDRAYQRTAIGEELADIVDRYGDERRTRIVPDPGE